MKTLATSSNQLVVFDQPEQETRLVARHIESLAAARGPLSILEAGCGNSWQVELPNTRYELTGVDLNEDALNIRKNRRGDLDHIILGDLRTVALEDNSFDVIYNSFVLEHVTSAERVLDNFQRWLAPGGILILRIPDRRSVYGLIARATPFWFHVLYKRYIAGVKTAGKPGYDPFPTVYEPIVSRQGIRSWCASQGLTIQAEIGWNYRVGRPGLVSHVVGAAIKALGLLSLGRLDADHVNLTYVIEKSASTTVPFGSSCHALPAEVTQ
jgi:ubiquinone/menaquinone biosynthesis C-methylase UbiE